MRLLKKPMRKNNHFILNEHKCLFVTKDGKFTKQRDGNIGVPKKVFEEVETYVLKSEDDGIFALVPGYKNSLGKVLQAQQFVGIIETKSGIVIEILPKITEIHSRADTIKNREVFLKMLRTLRSSPFKHLNTAHLNTQKFHLLEIFIAMFLEELTALVKRGVRQNYTQYTGNMSFLKGKLKLKEQMKKNSIHKDRFFVEYDEFSADIPENRLIKKTLKYLYAKSGNSKNQQRIREFLFVFDEVPTSQNIEKDFSQVFITRQMAHYEIILQWCRVFLNKESFTAFKGDSVAVAILFDMNRIFEDYVYSCLRKTKNQKVLGQVATQYLVQEPKRFRLKPDLLIDDNIVGDTKWKIIKKERDVSQADMYQMYAYSQKYERKEVWLIYPKNNDFSCSWKTEYFFDEGHSLKIKCFDQYCPTKFQAGGVRTGKPDSAILLQKP
jgi:5-methylcytosine-specific restriction enzyme subunit McrC